MTDSINRLYDEVRAACDRLREAATIAPSWIATDVMRAINFPMILHELGYLGCHAQLKQIARSFCRKHFDPVESEQPDIFPETLQERYPLARSAGAEPEYGLLSMLSEADYDYNIARLRREIAAKQKHADALEVHKRLKFQAA